MTNDAIVFYKERMKKAPKSEGVSGNEWDVVDELLRNPPDEFEAILEWIFSKHVGYVQPRVIAGQKLLELNPEKAWLVVANLLKSDDPDDRDTGVNFIENVGDLSKLPLLKPLLNDYYAYIQVDVARLLLSICPKDVQEMLQKLEYHESKHIRDQAVELLQKIKD